MQEYNEPVPDFNKKGTRKKRKLPVIIWVLLGFLIFLIGILAAIVIFINSTLNQINRIDPSDPWLTPEQAEDFMNDPALEQEFQEEIQLEYGDSTNVPHLQEENMTWPSAPQDELLLGEEEHIINILLVGQDRRPGEARARSDSMMLVSVNTEKKTVFMISFMRDTYVQIPGGYKDNRLNVAYRFGGTELMNEAFALNFGVYIDGNMEVDFANFQKIIDTLGGVDIELTSAEAAHLNIWFSDLRAGMNHLNGEQALAYSRIRKLDSDFGRTNRQYKVLHSILNSMKDISITEAINLTNTLLPMVSTNMSNAQIVRYLGEIYPIITNQLAQGQAIERFTVPMAGGYYGATIRGMMVKVPDLEYCREYLNEHLR